MGSAIGLFDIGWFSFGARRSNVEMNSEYRPLAYIGPAKKTHSRHAGQCRLSDAAENPISPPQPPSVAAACRIASVGTRPRIRMKSTPSDFQHSRRSLPSTSFLPLSPKTQTSRYAGRYGKDSGRQKSSRGIVWSTLLAATLTLGAGLARSPAASAHDTLPNPSAYCKQLAAQFDEALLTSSASRFLAEARTRRESGWAQCSGGKVGQGENTLKGAIRDLGATPEPRSPRPLL